MSWTRLTVSLLLLLLVTSLAISNHRLKSRAQDSLEVAEKAFSASLLAQDNAREAIKIAGMWKMVATNHQASSEFWAAKYRDQLFKNAR